MSAAKAFDKGDKELKKLASDFFDLAWKAKGAGATFSGNIFSAPYGFRYMSSSRFKMELENVKAEDELVTRSVKLLGSKTGSEKEVEDAAWKVADEVTSDDTQQAVAKFIEELVALHKATFIYRDSNYVIRFEENIREIEIGPVKARRTDDLIADLKKLNTKPHWEVTILGRDNGSTGKIIFPLFPVCWEVTLNAAKNNAREEGRWLINVALSLLRLCHPSNHTNPMFPELGKKEDDPIVPADRLKTGFLSNEASIIGGEQNLPSYYFITQDMLDEHKRINFDKITTDIFFHAKDSVGERVFQGLGWMARGRQSHDRAERFLFFFTAIEALLASSDKTAPVIQTICRHAAAILSNDATVRFNIARDIKGSYEIRSALVHSGRRNVSHTDALKAQLLTETLYALVIQKGVLTRSSKDFETDLSQASYGADWPLK